MEAEARLRQLLGELQIVKRAVRKKQEELNVLLRESATREWMSTEDYLQQMLQSVLNSERFTMVLDEQTNCDS